MAHRAARANRLVADARATTIFALSSGPPPAGIAVVRISGPASLSALQALTRRDRQPVPRQARLMRLYDPDKPVVIDQALTLWFPGPASVTGEDLAELHLHGGRAVVAAVLSALGRCEGLRAAAAGEFTRRAFENGRIDLAEAEGLADLLAAETEYQRQAAMLLAEGALGRQVDAWQALLLGASALVESELDFSDESDVKSGGRWRTALASLHDDLSEMLAQPAAERLHDGLRIVLAGPPNAGKSSLFNCLIERDAAIVTDVAGTTRDRIEAPVTIDGIPMILIDTAGLRDNVDDRIEAIGIERTNEALLSADMVIWMGAPEAAPEAALIVHPKADLQRPEPESLPSGIITVSVATGEGLAELRQEIVLRAAAMLPRPDRVALNRRHRDLVALVDKELVAALDQPDLILVAEHLRLARTTLDAITGRSGVEDMLDTLFSSFCIGK